MPGALNCRSSLPTTVRNAPTQASGLERVSTVDRQRSDFRIALKDNCSAWRVIEAQHLQEQSANHFWDELKMIAEICHGPDCFRQNDQRRRSEAQALQQFLHHLNADDHAADIIVYHGRVAEMGAENEGLITDTARDAFANFKRTNSESMRTRYFSSVSVSFRFLLQQSPQSRS